MSNTTAPRRTQAERRAETSAKLVDATIQILSELGYVQTSVKAVCDRAGVSHGALFGRYASRLDLIVAAAAEISHRQLDRFAQNVALLPESEDPAIVLPILRESARTPINAVWAELLVAARTDDQLRARLAPVYADYGKAIIAASETVPAIQHIPENLRIGVLTVLIYQFDGDALSRLPFPSEELDRLSMDVFIAMIRAYQNSVS